MTGSARVPAVRRAVRRYAALDPEGWQTGLSPGGARLALRVATELVLDAELGRPRGIPPRNLLIWCAGTVFTAPLEWTALFAALGSRVTLKAPRGRAAPVEALARAFRDEGIDVAATAPDHSGALALLHEADALLAFGSDDTMRALAGSIPPGLRCSLHGHRVSFAVLGPRAGQDEARAVVQDAVLHDGRGCLSPAAVLCMGSTRDLATWLADELERASRRVPRGPLLPHEGAAWRRRGGLARIVGHYLEGPDWAVHVLPPNHLEPAPLPRLLAVHPLQDLDELERLRHLPLSTCGTDLDAAGTLVDLGFERICRPGLMQRPPVGRPHDGADVIRRLSRQVSIEP